MTSPRSGRKARAPKPKTHARKWHEGSVREVRPGVFRAWRARVRKPDGTSTRSTRTFYGDGAEAAAVAWAKGDPEPAVMYLGQHLERWLALRRTSLDPSTYARYEEDVAACGDLLLRPLAGITGEEWQKQADALLARWSRTHVLVWKANVSTGLRTAIPRYLDRNPLASIKLPTAQEEPPKVWTQVDVDRLLGVAGGARHEPWLMFMLGTGVRLGESRALLWKDVDLAAKTATIRAALDNKTNKLGPTKNRKLRVVELPDEVVVILAEHRKRQAPGEQLVFGHAGRAYTTSTYRSWFRRLCGRADVDPHPIHSLRHTCASLALARRVPVADVARQLGHTVEVCQRTYHHYIGEGQRLMARALGGSLRHRFSGPKRQVGTRNDTRKSR